MAVVRVAEVGGVRVTWEGLVEEQIGSNRDEGFWRRSRWCGWLGHLRRSSISA
jgi:hypothetical protein